MCHRGVATSTWYVQQGGDNLWLWSECGTEVRTAATFVARIREGHGDLTWLARTIHQ